MFIDLHMILKFQLFTLIMQIFLLIYNKYKYKMPFTKLYNKLLNRNQKQDRFTSGHTDMHMGKTIMPLALSGDGIFHVVFRFTHTL
jgi:hypothetical protein